MAKTRAHVIVRGLVQGVAFRYSTVWQAQELNITGWVRNAQDGAVEAVFEGDEDDVRRMADWCRTGPPSAEVSGVDADYSGATGEFNGFRVVR